MINTRTDDFIENARVTGEGTALETFSDSAGQDRLSDVPAGPATVSA